MTPAINIYKADGTVLMEAVVTKDGVSRESLMTEDCIALRWSAPEYAVLPEGAYVIDDAGERYRLISPYYPSQKDEVRCDYAPEFFSRVMCWETVPLFFYTYAADGATITSRETEWSLTATPGTFMAYFARVIKAETGEQWSVTVSDDIKLTTASVTFRATNVLSGLNSVAAAFGTEWRADKKTNTLHLGAAAHGAPVRLEVGGNVSVPSTTTSRQEYGNRYYVLGSSRNITQSYEGANVNNLVTKRLTLDPAKYPGGYIDTRPGLAKGEIVPRYLTFDNIYPRSALVAYDVRCRLVYRLDESGAKMQVGTTADGSPIYDQYAIWYFKARDKVTGKQYLFDVNDLIKGQTLSVSFLGGALTGRDFELTYHDSSKVVKTSDGTPLQVDKGDFEINFVEDSGYIIPAVTALVPADGDALALFNINMPAEYHASAYLELETAAMAEISRRIRDLNNYEIRSNPVAFYDNDPGLTVGRNVIFVNVDGREITTRVLSITRKLDRPCEQTITLGNEVVKGAMSEIKDNVVSANTNLAVISQLQELNTAFTQAYARTQQQLLDGLARYAEIWKIDDEGNVYTERNVYSHKDVVAGGKAPAGSGGGVGGGAANLFDLLDVVLTAPRGVGDILVWDGAKWVNKPQSSIQPNLTGYATQIWVEQQGYLKQHQSLAGYAQLSDLAAYLPLTGGTLTGPLKMGGDGIKRIYFADNEHYLELDEDGNFCFSHNVYSTADVVAGGKAPAGGGIIAASNLSDLLDVNLVGLTVGDLIHWDGTKWVNVKASSLGIGGGTVDLSNIMRGVSLDKNVNFDANVLTDRYVIYDSNGDLKDGSGTWLNFPGVKPNGSFVLINFKEGGYHKQLYTGYDSNRVYIRNTHWDSSTRGKVWSGWDSLALISDLSNYVTLDTTQTITGAKTFTNALRTNSYAYIGVTSNYAIMMGGGSGYIWIDCRQGTSVINNIVLYPHCTTFGKYIKAPSFVKDGGTSAQFLKANGDVDGNSYVPWSRQSVATVNNTNLNPQVINIEDGTLISGYGEYWNVVNLGSYSNGNFRTQIAMPYQNTLTDTELFVRSANSSSWRDWRRVIHTGNYTSILDTRYLRSMPMAAPTANFHDYMAGLKGINWRSGDTSLAYGAMRAMDVVLDIGNSYARFVRLMHNCKDGNLRFQGSSNADSANTAAWGTERTLLDTVNYAGLIDGRYVKKSGDTMTGRLTITKSTADDSAGYTNGLSYISTTGVKPYINIGYASGKNNGANIGFCYKGNQSADNYIFLGFVANNELMCLTASGTVDITHREYRAINLKRTTAGGGCAISCTTGDNVRVGDFGFDGNKFFNVRNASGASLLCALQNGNIGIGTTNPTSKLHVTGDIAMTTNTSETAILRDTTKLIRFNDAATVILPYKADVGWIALRCGDPKVQTGSKELRLLSTGSVLIGTTTNSSGAKLHVDGSIYSTVENTTLSDRRVKSDIRALAFRGALTPRTYIKDGKRSIGFIAQEVDALYPELVNKGTTPGALWSLNYGAITAVLAAQLGVHEDELTKLRRRVAQLETEIKNYRSA